MDIANTIIICRII